MHEWTGNTVDYILEDGLYLYGSPSSSFGGNLSPRRKYGNFIVIVLTSTVNPGS